MFDVIVDQIIQLKTLIFIIAAFTVVAGLVLSLCCLKMGWLKKNMKLIGFFYDMTTLDCITLAIAVIKIGIIITVLVSGGRIEMVHLVMFGILVVAGGMIRMNLKEFFMNLVHGIIMIGILFLANVLSSYLHEVIFDTRILIVFIMLGIFNVLYAIYDLCYVSLAIIQSDKKGHRTIGEKYESKKH